MLTYVDPYHLQDGRICRRDLSLEPRTFPRGVCVCARLLPDDAVPPRARHLAPRAVSRRAGERVPQEVARREEDREARAEGGEEATQAGEEGAQGGFGCIRTRAAKQRLLGVQRARVS